VRSNTPACAARTRYDALNRYDLDGFCELFAEDFVDHGDVPPSRGRAAIRQHLGPFLFAFPDLHTASTS
jgi:ketosteroid isomerase-like protein